MTTILIKKKDTTGAPSSGDLTNATGGAEIAVNTFDKRLYTKDSGGTVVELGTNPTDITTGTVDTTNIEVTNIKAKDGTAAGSIADSTGVVTLASSVLTTTDINGGTIDGTAIGGASAAAGSFTTLNTSGAVVFNDAGADVDFRVEGDTDANLLFVDASADAVGIGTNAPAVSGLEISKATGSATPTPVELRLATTTSASDWSTTDPWGRLSFYSADASGSGPKIHAAIEATAISASGNGTSLDFKVNTTGSNTLRKTLSFFSGGSTTATIFYAGAEAEAARFNISGNLAFPDGQGIDFSASAGGGASSSILDDYEEGTWTPAYSAATSGSVSYGVQVGRYTKVGNVVTVVFTIYTASTSSPSGTISITGLPFTTLNVSSLTGGVAPGQASSFASDLDIRIYFGVNNTSLGILKNATGSGAVFLQGSDLSSLPNRNVISCSLSYFTA